MGVQPGHFNAGLRGLGLKTFSQSQSTKILNRFQVWISCRIANPPV
jgi:hypothetical protein